MQRNAWDLRALFWDFTKRRVVGSRFRNNLSVQSSRVKQFFELLDPWKWDRNFFPKRRNEINIWRYV